jgi:hypothetical protein
MTNREKLRKSMYYIYNMDFLPLDTGEYMAMFFGLANTLNISLDAFDWDCFIEEINCLKASDEKWFTEIFDKYF